MSKDSHIDAYVANAHEFSRPILRHLRALVHQACPRVQETMKWRMPSFEYEGIICGIAAFKQHCTFGFWKHELIKELRIGQAKARAEGILDGLGKIRSLEELPSDRTLRALDQGGCPAQ